MAHIKIQNNITAIKRDPQLVYDHLSSKRFINTEKKESMLLTRFGSDQNYRKMYYWFSERYSEIPTDCLLLLFVAVKTLAKFLMSKLYVSVSSFTTHCNFCDFKFTGRIFSVALSICIQCVFHKFVAVRFRLLLSSRIRIGATVILSNIKS